MFNVSTGALGSFHGGVLITLACVLYTLWVVVAAPLLLVSGTGMQLIMSFFGLMGLGYIASCFTIAIFAPLLSMLLGVLYILGRQTYLTTAVHEINQASTWRRIFFGFAELDRTWLAVPS